MLVVDVAAVLELGRDMLHRKGDPEDPEQPGGVGFLADVLARFEQTIQKPEGPVVVLASSSVRFFMRQLAEGVSPNLVFISHNEVPSEVRVVNLGTVH